MQSTKKFDMLAVFRCIFGLYLTTHFVSLIPVADELFGSNMPFDPKLSPTSFFPNLLKFVDAKLFVGALVFLSMIMMIAGHRIYGRAASLVVWYGWACLLNRNPLISNPGIPYVGWLLITCGLINKKIPPNISQLAWFMMGCGYTISGLHKLQCPSWIDGTAMIHVLNSPLARDTPIRSFVLSMPEHMLKIMSWGGLALEICGIVFAMFRSTRLISFILFIGFHLSIILLINFMDLTLGVMMIHIFTIDPEWIEMIRKKKKKND